MCSGPRTIVACRVLPRTRDGEVPTIYGGQAVADYQETPLTLPDTPLTMVFGKSGPYFGMKGAWLTFWVTVACATDMVSI
jgi:hypothetical protein